MVSRLQICFLVVLLLGRLVAVQAQVSHVWVADQEDGTYKNPILHADYSDPDVIRVGEDFYLISSSFNSAPGLPILHSRDLVNWTIIGHALPKQFPIDVFEKPQHGKGVWAPSIRYHNGLFYIYFPDPDYGIYVTTAKQIKGPWSNPQLVKKGIGLIDPCPLWDNDGKAYLTFALAGSRAGIKSVLLVSEMTPDGLHVSDAVTLVLNGHAQHPTVEGPKFYKRNGYYYISAPAGGVATGWQVVLRAKNPLGPYEEKIVLAQGNTDINGPHQGAWVDTPTGEWWFIHFQDKGPYGRVVHLQPMSWQDNWPVLGEDPAKTGIGQPVTTWKKPNVGKKYPLQTPQESDDFSNSTLGLQWQWNANPQLYFGFPSTLGYFFHPTFLQESTASNLYDFPNMLLQKFPAPTFTATAKMAIFPNKQLQTEQWGLIVKGFSYAWIGLTYRDGKKYVVYQVAQQAKQGKIPLEKILTEWTNDTLYLRVVVQPNAQCRFAYSADGETFTWASDINFQAEEGQWIGSQLGFFAARKEKTNDAGYAQIDWFKITP
ncbi:MAG: glycoside hydrolase 43 family protein [Spirosomataceae bacterium]